MTTPKSISPSPSWKRRALLNHMAVTMTPEIAMSRSICGARIPNCCNVRLACNVSSREHKFPSIVAGPQSSSFSKPQNSTTSVVAPPRLCKLSSSPLPSAFSQLRAQHSTPQTQDHTSTQTFFLPVALRPKHARKTPELENGFSLDIMKRNK